MTDETATTSELTLASGDNRMPPHDNREDCEPSAAATSYAGASGESPAPEPAAACRPYFYEEVAPAAEGGTPAPRVSSHADRHESDVEVVETDGVVREFVVICSCGRRTRLRIDYGEAS